MIFDETITDFLMELDVPLRQVSVMSCYVGVWAELEDTRLCSGPLPAMVQLHLTDQLDGFHHRIFCGLPIEDVQTFARSLNDMDTQDVPVDYPLMSPEEHAGYLSSMISSLADLFNEYQDRWGMPFSPFMTGSSLSKLSTMIEAVATQRAMTPQELETLREMEEASDRLDEYNASGGDDIKSTLERLEKEGGSGLHE